MRVDSWLHKFVNPPRGDWQLEGIERLISPPGTPHLLLFDDVGMGKTYQIINAASIMFEERTIDSVLVIAPAAVKEVWTNEVTGEIMKHSWTEFSICRVDATHPEICPAPPGSDHLRWYVVSYPFLRSKSNLERLIRSIDRHAGKLMLVGEECSHIKNPQATQSKATISLRHRGVVRAGLNATPLANNVMDYWNQVRFADDRFLLGRNYYQFRARFAKMGGYMGKNIVGVQNLPELQRDIAPLVLQRRRELPVTYATVPVRMPDDVYPQYVSMRDKMIAELEGERTSALHAGTKVLRLAQITSGFLGGFKSVECVRCGAEETDHDYDACDEFLAERLPPKEIDDSKSRAAIDWLLENPQYSAILVCRFVPEILRLSKMMHDAGLDHGLMYGGNKSTRQGDINDFMLQRRPSGQYGKSYLIAQEQTGSEGLNLTTADVVLFLSNDYSRKCRVQMEGRPRPGPGHPVLYVDFLMSTPNGRRTIDHIILKKIAEKNALAETTSSEWLEELKMQ